jgi:hypothetical protein
MNSIVLPGEVEHMVGRPMHRQGVLSRRSPRLVGATALAMTALLALGASATAAERTTVKIDSTVKQTGPGFDLNHIVKEPTSLILSAAFTASSEKQVGALVKMQLFLPNGAVSNGSLFPSCNPGALERRGANGCPRGSKIGSGRLIGVAQGVHETVSVGLFNGSRGRAVIIYLQGFNPLLINQAIVAPLVRLHGRHNPFGYRLTVDVPKNLQMLTPGIPTQTLSFTTTVGATISVRGRRHAYIDGVACPPGWAGPLKGVFDFQDAPTTIVNSSVRCPV